MIEKLTVKEYARLRGVSEKTIYNWIESKRIEYIEDTIQNRSVKFILVSTVPKPVDNYNEDVEQNKASQLEQRQELEDIPIRPDFLNLLSEMQQQNSQLVDDIKKYAELAGQTKLLTDSEARTKEEYFKVIQENGQLKAKLEHIQEQLNLYQKPVKPTNPLYSKLQKILKVIISN